MKRIGILNSGGNSTASNLVLKELFLGLQKSGYELYAVHHGYEGLMKLPFFKVGKKDMEHLDECLNIYLKTSRSLDFMTEQGTDLAVQNIKKNKIDLLVITGGNGSIFGAKRLADHNIPVLTIPSTIDNDLGYTDFALGFDTAVQNATDATLKIHSALSNDNRGAIIETMGRECDDIAVAVAKNAGADLLVTKKPDREEIGKKMQQIVASGVESPLVIILEYLTDIQTLALDLTKFTGKVFKPSVLGYIQRGGVPSQNDRKLAKRFSMRVLKLIQNKTYNRSVGIKQNKIFDIELQKAISIKKAQ